MHFAAMHSLRRARFSMPRLSALTLAGSPAASIAAFYLVFRDAESRAQRVRCGLSALAERRLDYAEEEFLVRYFNGRVGSDIEPDNSAVHFGSGHERACRNVEELLCVGIVVDRYCYGARVPAATGAQSLAAASFCTMTVTASIGMRLSSRYMITGDVM